jgi:hypothetical protein
MQLSFSRQLPPIRYAAAFTESGEVIEITFAGESMPFTGDRVFALSFIV